MTGRLRSRSSFVRSIFVGAIIFGNALVFAEILVPLWIMSPRQSIGGLIHEAVLIGILPDILCGLVIGDVLLLGGMLVVILVGKQTETTPTR